MSDHDRRDWNYADQIEREAALRKKRNAIRAEPDVLKSCPFCGAPGAWWQDSNGEDNWVGCANRACQIQPMDVGRRLAVQESQWNTRPIEDALRAENARLKAQWAEIPWNALEQLIAEVKVHNRGFTHWAVELIAHWINDDAPEE